MPKRPSWMPPIERIWPTLSARPNEHEVDRLEAQADEHEAAKVEPEAWDEECDG